MTTNDVTTVKVVHPDAVAGEPDLIVYRELTLWTDHTEQLISINLIPRKTLTMGKSTEREVFDSVFPRIAKDILDELPTYDAMPKDGIDWLKKVCTAVDRATANPSKELALQRSWWYEHLHSN